MAAVLVEVVVVVVAAAVEIEVGVTYQQNPFSQNYCIVIILWQLNNGSIMIVL